MIVHLEIDTDNTGPQEEAILAALRGTEPSPDEPETLEAYSNERRRLIAMLDRIEQMADEAIRSGLPLEHRRALGGIYQICRDGEVDDATTP